MTKNTDTSTIQEKMARLDERIAWFDSEDFAIEEAIDRFSEAEKLAEEIKSDLASFKNDITVIKQRFDDV